MAIEAQFVITQDLLDKLYQQLPKRRADSVAWHLGRLVLGFAFVFGVPTAVLLLLNQYIAVMAGWLVSLFVVPWYVWGSARRESEARDVLVGLEQVVEVSDSGLQIRGKTVWTRYDWTHVDRMACADGAVFITLADQGILAVPSSAFASKADEHAFVACVQQQVDHGRYRDGPTLQSSLDGEVLQQIGYKPARRKRSLVADAILLLAFGSLLAGSVYLAQGGPIREVRVNGRFWQGRFRTVKLCDEAAILACAAYVDLNPIRAGIAITPEGSNFTSVQRRVEALAHATTEQDAERENAAVGSPTESASPKGAQLDHQRTEDRIEVVRMSRQELGGQIMAPKRKILFPPTKTVRSKAEIKRAVLEAKAAFKAGKLDIPADSGTKKVKATAKPAS